jgi:hypothetical protein
MAQKPADDPRIHAKIMELADMIAGGATGESPEAVSLRRFTCSDYQCTGQNFNCTSFRCPGAFKIPAQERAVEGAS